MGNVMGAVLALFVLVPNNAAGRSFTVAAGVAAALLTVALIRRKITYVSNSIWLLISFYLVVIIGTLAQNSPQSTWGVLQVAIPMTLLALVATVSSPNDFRRVLWWIVMLGLIEAIVAIIQKQFHMFPTWGWLGDTSAATFGYNEITSEIGRTPGTMGHAIPLALWLGLSIICVLSGHTIRRFALRIVTTVLLAYAMILTGSRSAILVLVVVIAFMLVVMIRNAFIKTVLTLAAIGGLLVVNIPGLPIFASLQGSISFTHRADSLATLQQLVSLGPAPTIFGLGWDAFAILSALGVGADGILAIDNGMVSLIAISGLIGVACVATIVIRGFIRGDNCTRALLLMIGGMFLSFDVALWTAALAPLIVFSYANSRADPRRSLSPTTADQNREGYLERGRKPEPDRVEGASLGRNSVTVIRAGASRSFHRR